MKYAEGKGFGTSRTSPYGEFQILQTDNQARECRINECMLIYMTEQAMDVS